jgi:hypothetical protein
MGEAIRGFDRLEITDLVSRLGRWLDRAGDDAPERVLASDVTVRTPGGEAQGIDRALRVNGLPLTLDQDTAYDLVIAVADGRLDDVTPIAERLRG